MENILVNKCGLKITDIVAFSNQGEFLASNFCFNNKLTGKIVGEDLGKFAVDFGLYYIVYANPEELILITTQSDAPTPSDV